VDTLEELYLTLEHADGTLAGFGETRANIEYLTGVATDRAVSETQRLVSEVDWSRKPTEIIAELPTLAHDFPSQCLALADCTLVDAVARAQGRPLAKSLGGSFRPVMPTNQTLFWNGDEAFERMAKRYVARGFTDLKVRVGIDEFSRDLARISRLRSLFGDCVKLALDANGRWPNDEVLGYLRKLEPLDIAYAEQPLPTGDWDAVRKLADASPIPIMLDEGMGSLDDVDRMCAIPGRRACAHLKIVKLGGLTPVIEAARRLTNAGVTYMIGQMNEGGAATAAACHAAMACSPTWLELYGADGLLDDPAPGLAYRDGGVHLPRGSGLGLALDASKTTTLWEKTV
jgi:L-alanine-DL-glutamate epimerase-like enolase superfamily enzyme